MNMEDRSSVASTAAGLTLQMKRLAIEKIAYPTS
jgi:hypothetical protein